jgi:hypothetical protein
VSSDAIAVSKETEEQVLGADEDATEVASLFSPVPARAGADSLKVTEHRASRE